MASQVLLVALTLVAVPFGAGCSRSDQETPPPERAIASQASEHAVLVHLKLSDDGFGSREEFAKATGLEKLLEEAIARAGVGELDGNEVGGGEFVIYTYGPDADRLQEVVQPLVLEARWATGGRIRVRRGAPGAPEIEVAIPAEGR